MEKIPIRHIPVPPKEPDFSQSFIIRDIQTLLAGKNMVQELHRHDYFYMLVLNKGAGEHEIDFRLYQVGDNCVFFMRPGQVHRLVLNAGSTGYLMQFKAAFYNSQDKLANQLLRKASNTNHYQLDANGLQKLLSIMAYIFQEFTSKQERYPEVIEANITILLVELVRQHNKSPSDNINLYVQERFEEFIGLLETHGFSHKQVSQYAAMLNLSPYQLNAVTKTTLGKTCAEVIEDHIILEAKRLLLATSNQVNQIAYQLGYEDVSYFIRFFKKHTGYSPAAFRQNFK